MSILKFTNGKNKCINAIKKGVDYILNPEKTKPYYIAGNGISLDSPCEDMQTVQALHRKQSGRQYIHYIISFDTDVAFDTAFNAACECARYFEEDYQYLLSLHINTDNPHAHIVLNSVNVHNGKKFSQSKTDLLKFREYVSDCLIAHGLNPIEGHKKAEDFLYSCTSDDPFAYDYDDYDDYDDLDLYESEEEDYEDTQNYSNIFGPLDIEECQQIEQAMEHERKISQVIAYFNGDASRLPEDISFLDAESIYLEYTDFLRSCEEEEDNGFFR